MNHRDLTILLLLAIFLASAIRSDARGYEITNRWTSTITDGGGISQGDPITLLWSIVPDGEDYSRSNDSNLIDYLDDGWNVAAASRIPELTDRPWWSVMNDVYEQYSRVSGITMLYEPEQTPTGADTGQEGDLRIGGQNIDSTTGGVLADNSFPNNGDMRIDTTRDSSGNASFWHSNAAQLRNLVAHESGHGVGLNHSDISGADAVMETPLETSFWGLQFDDIYALNQNYGDPYEKGGGNDTFQSGTDLGSYNTPIAISLGTDAGDSVVDQFDDDWLGIDGISDHDWFKFSVGKSAFVDIRVAPMGPSYTTEEQGSFVGQARADLNFKLFAADGTTLLHSADTQPIGGTESLDGLYLPDAGDYYIDVGGDADMNQFYQLDLDVSPTDFRLIVDRRTGEVVLSSIHAPGGMLGGYSIHSPSGSLNPSDAGWSSFSDQGVAGWVEVNPAADTIAEVTSSPIDVGGAESLSLGAAYRQVISAPFGTIAPDDLVFEYIRDSVSEPTSIQGVVTYRGDPFFNNLVLTVDPDTGRATLTNESETIVEFSGYTVNSASNSLIPGTWLSLADQGLAAWVESNQTEGFVSELAMASAISLDPGIVFDLGVLFDTGGSRDLGLTFLLQDDAAPWSGVVVYEELTIPGDFDGDGDVDGADLLAWQRGESPVPLGGLDLANWQANRGVAANALIAAATTLTAVVPEPRSLVLGVMASLFGITFRQRLDTYS